MNFDIVKADFVNYKDVSISYATNFIPNTTNVSLEQLENAVNLGIPFALEFAKNESLLETQIFTDVYYTYTFKNGLFAEFIDMGTGIRKTRLSGDDYNALKSCGNVSIEFIRNLISERIDVITFANVYSFLYELELDTTYFECSRLFTGINEFEFLIENKIPLTIQLDTNMCGINSGFEYLHIRYTETGELNIYVTDLECVYDNDITSFEREQVKLVKLMDNV